MQEILLGTGGGVLREGDPDDLLAGDMELGFFGEVKASDFITGNELVQLYNYPGVKHNSDAGWLKFALDGKTLYVAKKSLGYRASWPRWATQEVTFRGKRYLVRQIEGYASATNNGNNTEWNKLMYRVCSTPTGISSDGIMFGEWMQYSPNELGFIGDGSQSWVPGIRGSNSGVLRGGSNITSIHTHNVGTAAKNTHGYRPVLELLE